jgi:hypothetical protein
VARADDPPFTIGSRPTWFLLGGVTAGGTVGMDDRGGLVGGELSLARLREGDYLGVYADAYYDWGVDGAYLTVGPEIGRKFVSLDGGFALRFADGERDPGAAVRLTVGVGILAGYVRYAWFDAEENDHVIQIGGLLKFPLVSPFGGH